MDFYLFFFLPPKGIHLQFIGIRVLANKDFDITQRSTFLDSPERSQTHKLLFHLLTQNFADSKYVQLKLENTYFFFLYLPGRISFTFRRIQRLRNGGL